MKIFKSLIQVFCLLIGILVLIPFAGIPAHLVPQSPAPRSRVRTARRAGAAGRVSLSKRRSWHGPTPATEAQFSSLTNLGVALRAVFFDQLQAIAGDSLIDQLFNVQNSGRAVERNEGVGGLSDIPIYTGVLEYDGNEPLYLATYTHVERARGIAVERKLIDDDEYGVIKQRASNLGMGFDRTIEKSGVSVFNNAFTSTALGPDSKMLCATDHPYSPTDSSTQGNSGTSALTHDAIIATKKLMMKFKDSRGEIMPVMPDTLLVPTELYEEASVIVGSNQKSGTANNDKNVNTGYKVITSRYLTDSNDWFMIDSRLAKNWLNWFWRVRPEFTTDPLSDFNLVSRFRGYMRYSYGWDTWQWIYGHHV